MRIGLSLKLSEPKYNVLAQNIRALFADGSQGWWYDDNDTTTLFQDSDGAAPVTAVEQFVGLQLDKSKGLVPGPELVGPVWTLGPNWTQTGGTLSNSGGTAFSNAEQAILTIGKFYKVTFNVVSLSGGSLVIGVGATTQRAVTSSGLKTFHLTCSGDGRLFLQAQQSTTVVTISNISVRELPGNHRYAPASGNRPIWSKRVNLLTKTEQFDDAVWTKGNVTVTPNVTQDPNGTTTADVVDEGTTTNFHNITGALFSAGTYTVSVFAKNISAQYVILTLTRSAGEYCSVIYDTVGGTVANSGVGGIGFSVSSTSIVSVGNSWYRCVMTCVIPNSANFNIGLANSAAIGSFGLSSYTGTSRQLAIWGADARPANQATGLLPLYQRVNTSTDYETNGFPGYLKADGVDDFLQTNSIDFNTVTSDGLPRRNLLDNPTQFDTASWAKARTTITANASVAPDGTTTADLAVPTAVAGAHQVYYSLATVSAAPVTFSFYVKAAGYTNVQLSDASNGSFQATFDLSAVTSTGVSNSTTTISAVGNGWFRCVASLSSFASASRPSINAYPVGATLDNFGATFTGDGTSGVYIWGAQLETGSTATAFQNIGTDKITLCAGVRKLSDAAAGTVVDINGATGTNSFMLRAPAGATATYAFYSGGSVAFGGSALSPASYTSPITNVLTGVGDISGDSAILRINGAQAVAATGDQGTGNYSNLPVYFFRRQGTALPFNGHEYGNIAVGKLLTADQTVALETYINGLTRAY